MPPLIGRAIALVAVVVLSPLLIGLAILVRATSRGPVLHRARRVRPDGEFTIFKFRTMREGAAGAGPAVTARGDRRITRAGRILRKTKLDELPQLWNVVRGDMALVGPRPEDPRYVDRADPLHQTVFAALPGMTGPTALAYRNEEDLLAAAALDVARLDGRATATEADLERAYREVVLPQKLSMDAGYLRTRSVRGDISILGRTIGQVIPRRVRD